MHSAVPNPARLLAPLPGVGSLGPTVRNPSSTYNPIPASRRRRLGELLIEAGLIDELQLKAALSEQRKWGGRLGRTLVEMKFVTEDAMVNALSTQLQLPAVDLDKESLPTEVVQLLRGDVAERYGIFPIGGDRTQKVLRVASSDPTNQEMIKELGFTTGMRIQVAVASSSAIDRAIRRYYYGETHARPVEVDRISLGGGSILDLLEDAPTAGPTAPDLQAKVNELTAKVAELETTLTGQVKLLRTTVELLLEKGVVTREEWLAKVRGAR